jgi:hypothetical protein
MLLIGTLAFGGVLGWAAAFVEPVRAGLIYRLCVAVLGAAILFEFGWPVLTAALAGAAAGMFGHDVFAGVIRRRIG